MTPPSESGDESKQQEQDASDAEQSAQSREAQDREGGSAGNAASDDADARQAEAQDARNDAAGTQEDVAKSPVCFVYVSDHARFTGARRPVTDPARIAAWSNVHAGFIGQNVYLCAASENLGACFRASIDGPAVAKLLGLKPTQQVLYSQTVGSPAPA